MDLRNLQRATYKPTVNQNGCFVLSIDNTFTERVVDYDLRQVIYAKITP